jgi:hypothetical protein
MAGYGLDRGDWSCVALERPQRPSCLDKPDAIRPCCHDHETAPWYARLLNVCAIRLSCDLLAELCLH